MRRTSVLLFMLLIVFGVNNLLAQISADEYMAAEDLVEDGNFHKALELYQEMLKLSPNNANLNFKIGLNYIRKC